MIDLAMYVCLQVLPYYRPCGLHSRGAVHFDWYYSVLTHWRENKTKRFTERIPGTLTRGGNKEDPQCLLNEFE